MKIRKILIKISLLGAMLLIPPAMMVQAQFKYTTINNAVSIMGYTGFGGAVIIPGAINGLPVTSIVGEAFYRCTNLTSIVIGTNVTSIGARAFSECPSLISVTIPNSVTNIGGAAFSECPNLKAVTIPKSVSNIGNEKFTWGTNLTSVTNPLR